MFGMEQCHPAVYPRPMSASDNEEMASAAADAAAAHAISAGKHATTDSEREIALSIEFLAVAISLLADVAVEDVRQSSSSSAGLARRPVVELAPFSG